MNKMIKYMYIYHKLIIIDIPSFKLSLTMRYLFILLSTTISLLKKVEIPTEFRDGIYFFSNRDGIRDRKSS
jgi:hypothetical protein